MELIDENGNLFGKINLIDALVVLAVLVVIGAGASFVLGGNTDDGSTNKEQPARTETTITVRAVGLQPFVADAISEGPVADDSTVAVENKRVEPTTVVVRDQNGSLHEREHPRKQTVTLRLTVSATKKGGELLFQGTPLEIGQRFDLDLGTVTIKGVVVELDS